MSLSDLLQKPVNKKDGKVNEEITKERILENLDKYRELIAYWRFYPDRFVDYLCSLNSDNTFQLYFYLRQYMLHFLQLHLCL